MGLGWVKVVVGKDQDRRRGWVGGRGEKSAVVVGDVCPLRTMEVVLMAASVAACCRLFYIGEWYLMKME